ncbi:cytochrome P450 [Streptacidiphilus fuscans]|uniref:Cytochrome P450 n=1 Tax=Streptacidiphilus fuscans TaxID=2789292 RepID=A0A931FDM3_9ACTN|nr:cytochrome P450 [Streptacidiphilus fuscans]MBF9069708.1 cytochrome P450 [Streptacidiphilus fuscans]
MAHATEHTDAESHADADFSLFDPRFRADPYPGYTRLHAAGRLRRTAFGAWISPSYRVCSQVLRDPRFGRPELPEDGRTRSFLGLNPPDHTRLRRLAAKAFTPRLIEGLRPRIEELAEQLLDAALGQDGAQEQGNVHGQDNAQEQGEFDLVAAFAHPLPVIVISELLGVPTEDRDRFTAWSDTLARALGPEYLLPPDALAEIDSTRGQFEAYFRELAAQRRVQPTDDLLSALVAVCDDGEVLSEAELIATCTLLLIAGHETTVNLIANGTLALLREPQRLAWFRAHPEAAPAVVEELLRFDPPVQLTMRTALVDADVEGVPIAAGEQILLVIGAANRDPEVFADPDRLDFSRAENTGGSAGGTDRHLAFGLGIHFCLGAALARLEGQIALTAFARRVHEPELATDEVSYRDNLILRGPASLPVRHRRG